MSATSSLRVSARSLVVRTKPSFPRKRFLPTVQARFASDNTQNVEQQAGRQKPAKGPNMDQLPHVSEEQAQIDKSMGETPPDLERGTPIQEILERDNAQQNAPQVLKDEMKSNGANQKRSYSTSARRMADTVVEASPPSLISEYGMIAGMDYPDAGPGHKFPLPATESVSRMDHLKRRYDPIVDQVTKSIMRDGKLNQAQKRMSHILTILRTAPPPQPNPQFPSRTLLLTDVDATTNTHYTTTSTLAPATTTPSLFGLPQPTGPTPVSLPRPALPLHPIEYLTTAIDSVAPLIRVVNIKGAAGGGASLPIPATLMIRQRRRQAIKWILDAADKRKDVHLAERIAKEVIAVAEGKSSVWEKRALVHRLAVSARSNLAGWTNKKRRGRR